MRVPVGTVLLVSDATLTRVPFQVVEEVQVEGVRFVDGLLQLTAESLHLLVVLRLLAEAYHSHADHHS